MKYIIALVAAGLLALGGHQYWLANQHPDQHHEPPGPRLAEEGTYFLLEYHGVRTSRGVTGWAPGQQVKRVSGKQSEIGEVWVTDGQIESSVPTAILTREIDLAARLASSDTATQEQAYRRAQAVRDKQMADEKLAQADALRAQRLSTQTRTVFVAATPSNPLDRDAKATNGGRQVARSPDLPGVIYQNQTH